MANTVQDVGDDGYVKISIYVPPRQIQWVEEMVDLEVFSSLSHGYRMAMAEKMREYHYEEA